ncbi:zinc finger ccch domain-containing protein 14, partial [Quercus suber]
SSTQNRLNQARLILQYQELNDHYNLCQARLIELLFEAKSLRHENAELCLANAEILKLLSSQASFHNLLLSSSYPTEAIVKKSFFIVFSFFWASFELEMIFFCIFYTVWFARKLEKIEKKRKYFFIWIFNIIAYVDVLMWNFVIPRMEFRESGKGNPRKCWGFHFNGILIIR